MAKKTKVNDDRKTKISTFLLPSSRQEVRFIAQHLMKSEIDPDNALLLTNNDSFPLQWLADELQMDTSLGNTSNAHEEFRSLTGGLADIIDTATFIQKMRKATQTKWASERFRTDLKDHGSDAVRQWRTAEGRGLVRGFSVVAEPSLPARRGADVLCPGNQGHRTAGMSGEPGSITSVNDE